MPDMPGFLILILCFHPAYCSLFILPQAPEKKLEKRKVPEAILNLMDAVEKKD